MTYNPDTAAYHWRYIHSNGQVVQGTRLFREIGEYVTSPWRALAVVNNWNRQSALTDAGRFTYWVENA